MSPVPEIFNTPASSNDHFRFVPQVPLDVSAAAELLLSSPVSEANAELSVSSAASNAKAPTVNVLQQNKVSVIDTESSMATRRVLFFLMELDSPSFFGMICAKFSCVRILYHKFFSHERISRKEWGNFQFYPIELPIFHIWKTSSTLHLLHRRNMEPDVWLVCPEDVGITVPIIIIRFSPLWTKWSQMLAPLHIASIRVQPLAAQGRVLAALPGCLAILNITAQGTIRKWPISPTTFSTKHSLTI